MAFSLFVRAGLTCSACMISFSAIFSMVAALTLLAGVNELSVVTDQSATDMEAAMNTSPLSAIQYLSMYDYTGMSARFKDVFEAFGKVDYEATIGNADATELFSDIVKEYASIGADGASVVLEMHEQGVLETFAKIPGVEGASEGILHKADPMGVVDDFANGDWSAAANGVREVAEDLSSGEYDSWIGDFIRLAVGKDINEDDDETTEMIDSIRDWADLVATIAGRVSDKLPEAATSSSPKESTEVIKPFSSVRSVVSGGIATGTVLSLLISLFVSATVWIALAEVNKTQARKSRYETTSPLSKPTAQIDEF